MSNTINVNGMTGYYNSFIQSVTRKSTSKTSAGSGDNVVETKTDFKAKVASKVEVNFSKDVQKTDQATAVPTKDMSLEEYKQFIYDQIEGFRIDPSRSRDQYSINISDAGFEAMKNDPEYENWVLDYIKRDMAVAAPRWYTAMGGEPAYCILNFGATKEERTGNMFAMGFKNGQGKGIFNSHSDSSFWTNRGGQKKVRDRANQRAAEKKELEKKWLRESAEKRQAYTDFLNGKAMLKTNSLSEFNKFFSMPTDPKVAGILSAYEAGTFVGGGM